MTDTTMSASDATAEPGVNAITLAFIDGDSTISVALDLATASKLQFELGRVVRESKGMRVAVSSQ